jgi:Clp protease
MGIIVLDSPYLNQENYKYLLVHLQEKDVRTDPEITIGFDTSGGSATGLSEVITQIESMKTEGFYFIALIKKAHSAAALLALACQAKRYCPTSKMTLHTGSLEIEVAHIDRETSAVPRKQYNEALKHLDYYLKEVLTYIPNLSPQQRTKLATSGRLELTYLDMAKLSGFFTIEEPLF